MGRIVDNYTMDEIAEISKQRGQTIVDFAYRYEVLTKPHQNLKE